MNGRAPRRLVAVLGAVLAALAGGCDSYESAVPSCSGQDNCFAYAASDPVSEASFAGTLVFDEFPLSGAVSGTWAIERVGRGVSVSHPTGSGRFTGSTAVSTITMVLTGGDVVTTLGGDRSAVLIAGRWSGGRSGPFTATLRR